MSFYRLKKKRVESACGRDSNWEECHVYGPVLTVHQSYFLSYFIFFKAAVSTNFQYYADIICVADRVLEKGELSFRLNFWFVT